MDHKVVQQWERAVDAAEASPITANLPKDPSAGEEFQETGTDDIHRKWMAVEIISGNSGSRWAYWAPWIDPATGRWGVGPNPKHQAIADAIFNGDAAHFIGMIGVPYAKIPGTFTTVWVLVEPRLVAPRTVKIAEQPGTTRYEKSKEVFDVNTQETTKLP